MQLRNMVFLKSKLVLVTLVIGIFLFLNSVTYSTLQPIGHATIKESSADEIPRGAVTLPFLSQLGSTKLVTVTYEIVVPKVLNQKTHGILFAQVLNGGLFYLNGRLLSELPESNKARRISCYEPFQLTLPSDLLHSDQANIITIKQTSFQRSLTIPRMYFGENEQVQKAFGDFLFFSKSLPLATNLCCWCIGLFLFGIWLINPEKKVYGISGIANILWATLFTLALLHQVDTSLWMLWRGSLYIATGCLIVLMSSFLFSFCNHPLNPYFKYSMWSLTVIGPLLFMIFGKSIEYYLDIYWTGILLSTYLYALYVLYKHHLEHRTIITTLLILQSLFAFALAAHDYAVQAGFLVSYFDLLNKLGLSIVWMEPIYFSHLSLPLLLVVVAIILMREHADNTNALTNMNATLAAQVKKVSLELKKSFEEKKEIESIAIVAKEREVIYQEVHDRLGAKLLRALIKARSDACSKSEVEQEVDDSLNELRLIVNDNHQLYDSVQSCLADLCFTYSIYFNYSKINLDYKISTSPPIAIDKVKLLHLTRIIQESFSNILKHSQASNVIFRFRVMHGLLIVDIRDNGKGALLNGTSPLGKGLSNIKKRANELNGKLTWMKSKQSGFNTRLIFEKDLTRDLATH